MSEDEGVFGCLPQGGGFGESTYGQPHGPEQPLHPGRSREQLLSLTHRSESTENASVLGCKGLRPGKCAFSDSCFVADDEAVRERGAAHTALRPATTRSPRPMEGKH